MDDANAPARLPGEPVACPECRSGEVRPSQSAYPRDRETNADGAGGFWRCENCGDRFLGPAVPRKDGRHHRHRKSRDRLGDKIRLTRTIKRWIFPILVILVTGVAVYLILNRRNSQPLRPPPRRGVITAPTPD